jgi:hypothetical protein
VAGSCEHGNETSGPSDYQLLKKDPSQWIYVLIYLMFVCLFVC